MAATIDRGTTELLSVDASSMELAAISVPPGGVTQIEITTTATNVATGTVRRSWKHLLTAYRDGDGNAVVLGLVDTVHDKSAPGSLTWSLSVAASGQHIISTGTGAPDTTIRWLTIFESHTDGG